MNEENPYIKDPDGFGGEAHRLTIKRGGGMLIAFGFPFFAIGIFIAIGVSSGLLHTQGGQSASPLFAVLFGMLFALPGLCLMLGRAATVLDKDQEKIITWWGLLVPFKSKEQPLEGLDTVTLTKEVRRSDKSTYTVYPVRLSGGEKPMLLKEPRQYEPARRLAEQAAKFLDLPLEDSTSGEMIRREAGTLDESLRDRILRTGETVEMPERPANARSAYQTEGDTLVIDIPPLGFQARHILILFAGLLFPAMVCIMFLGPMLSGGKPPPLFFLAFIGVFFIGLPLLLTWGMAFRDARKRARVRISSALLEVRQQGLLLSKTIRIPTSELEELTLTRTGRAGLQSPFAPNPELRARSDRAVVDFGRGLQKQELEWLYDIVRYMVVTEAG